MRISEVDPATAKTQAEKAVAAGVMETNADVARLTATPASLIRFQSCCHGMNSA